MPSDAVTAMTSKPTQESVSWCERAVDLKDGERFLPALRHRPVQLLHCLHDTATHRFSCGAVANTHWLTEPHRRGAGCGFVYCAPWASVTQVGCSLPPLASPACS
jgi:hypothetical protein